MTEQVKTQLEKPSHPTDRDGPSHRLARVKAEADGEWTASLAGLMPGSGIYGATKQAVVTLSESLYKELKLANSKIGVSLLCPASVSTNNADAARNRPGGASERRRS